MERWNSKTDFEEKNITPCGMHDSDENYFNDKLQETDSPYFSFENFQIVSTQLKEKAFSISYLNIRSLSKNIDKLKQLLASLNVASALL